jgi:hypothetical protein
MAWVQVALGWNVIEFVGFTSAKQVAWFEEKFEAQDEAERLNETAPEGVFYGWEKNR